MQSAYILRRTTLLISLVGWLVMQMYRGETAGRLELPLIIGVTLLDGAGAESPRIRKLVLNYILAELAYSQCMSTEHFLPVGI